MTPRFVYSPIAFALTSGTTSGTSGSIRNRAVLSTTTAPAATANGANFSLTDPPAEKSAMSTPANESSRKTLTRRYFSLNGKLCPADRSEARRRSSFTGKSRSSSTSRICSPTAPVAPTTATLYFSFFIGLTYFISDSLPHLLAADKLAARIFDIGCTVAFIEHVLDGFFDPV